MAHLQYMPGDPRLVDQLVYELKSKGIFDQFRKECIADVDTRPAYQNLRQRVETSVSTFLSRQCWKPDLNKNQLREKLRKHILDGNYLEQGVERIVDQVVNPKVASVFIPQVEDLVYNYLGITRKKTVPATETSNGKTEDLLPTDLEAVSPGSVKSNDDKNEMEIETDDTKMDIDDDKEEEKEESSPPFELLEKEKPEETQVSVTSELTSVESEASIDKSFIPLPAEDINVGNIPAPENSPPKSQVVLDKIHLPTEQNLSTDIPLPDEINKTDNVPYFKPINSHSDDDESSSDSSLRRNMSPLTPIRNYNNENSCDAQQAFENDTENKSDDKKEPGSFKFSLEAKSPEKKLEDDKSEKKGNEPDLSYQFNNQVNINTYNTPVYEDSSNSNNLQIDYESDANSKTVNNESKVPEAEYSEDSKKVPASERKEEKKSSHKSSHRSRDSHRHSGGKDKQSDSKHSTSRDSSRHDKKDKQKDDKYKSSQKESDKSKDRSDKKESRDSSKHRSSHKSSSHRDSKSHRSSSSSQRHSSSSSKHSDDKKSSKDKSGSSKDKDKSKDSKSSQRSDKDKKSNSKSKNDSKDKKKDKKEVDDHYSLSGRGNPNRRSTDRDSNDGSSSSKGFNNHPNSKSTEVKKENKSSSSKSDNTSTSRESTSQSDKEMNQVNNQLNQSKIIRVDLEVSTSVPPRLPFVPDVTIKKPKIAANFHEAKRLMKMKKFLDEEQKRMNQEAALLLEFQANVRPSLSQVYSSIPGPELEFACVTNTNVITDQPNVNENESTYEPVQESPEDHNNFVYQDTSIETNETSISQYEPIQESCDMVNRNMTVQEIENIIGVNITSDATNELQESFENSKELNILQTSKNDSIDLKQNVSDSVNDGDIEERLRKLTESSDEDIKENSHDNRPFSDIIEEITKYKNATENKKEIKSDFDCDENFKSNKKPDYFEITVIAEELSESEETEEKIAQRINEIQESNGEIELPVKVIKSPTAYDDVAKECPDEIPLEYFAEHEKYNAELERDKFSTFLNKYIELSKKIFLINCDTYEERIVEDVLKNFGDYKIVNYLKNGHLKLPKTANLVKNVNLSEEVTLPLDSSKVTRLTDRSMFSPKSECSFELSNEYDAKLEEMVNKTSRQQVMEIILGTASEEKMPEIDYCSESNIDTNDTLKRKFDVESSENNNTELTPSKVRRINSDTDQISSTTEDVEEVANNNETVAAVRSKYLGRARRVGLPKPRKPALANSPSSDKSIENYELNQQTRISPNGKMKLTPRSKIQRYDTSELYKPKLHYLSRRNNVT